MGRTTDYRANLVEIIESANDRYQSLSEDEEPYKFIGSPEEEFDIQLEIKEAEKILRLLDALKYIGIVEGKGFCDELAKVTGYSKTRISNMLSQATLNSRFIRAVCSGFGFNEEYIYDGKEKLRLKINISHRLVILMLRLMKRFLCFRECQSLIVGMPWLY